MALRQFGGDALKKEVRRLRAVERMPPMKARVVAHRDALEARRVRLKDDVTRLELAYSKRGAGQSAARYFRYEMLPVLAYWAPLVKQDVQKAVEAAADDQPTPTPCLRVYTTQPSEAAKTYLFEKGNRAEDVFKRLIEDFGDD